MAKDQILAKGLRFFDKHPSAPEFVLGTIVITQDDIAEMFRENTAHITEYNGKSQLKLQYLRSKEGKIYCTVDTYKKEGTFHEPATDNNAYFTKKDNTVADNDDSGLPF